MHQSVHTETPRPPSTGLWGSNSGKRRWVEPLLILVFWTLIAALTIGRRTIDPRSLQEGVRAGQILQALLEYSVWALITPGIFWLTRRFGVEREGWLGRIFLHLSIAVIVAAIFDVFGHATYAALVAGEERTFSLVNSLLTLRFLDELIIYLTVLAAGFARDYFMRYQDRQAEMLQLRTQAVQLQAQLAEARLQTLRMQVNPHFLFNTLHAVSSLVERDPRGVRRMIARLSELLRYTMERAGEQEVSLHEELLFLEGYLEIQQIRFQDRLEVEEDIDPEVLDALVPSLILQPLVENAIKHGVSRTEELGRIEIKAWREDETLCLSVRDNGPGLSDASEDRRSAPTEGVGLRNARERLQSLYGTAQRLNLESVEEGGARAEICLPFHTRADLHTVLSD